MELVGVEIPIKLGLNQFTIRHITDVHFGNPGHHRVLFDRFVRTQEADKNSYWICTGDLVDADRPSMRDRKAIMYADRRDALSQEDEESQDWLDLHVIPKLRRIKDRCLGLLEGDHYRLYANGDTSGKYICRKLGIKYLGERMAYVRLVFRADPKRSTSYVILARHGKGASSSPGGDVTALQKQSSQFVADLYLGGHTHKENIVPVPLLFPNFPFTDLKQKVLWYVRGGSFLCGFLVGKQLYPEQEEYGPLCTGWAEIFLKVFKSHKCNDNLEVVAESARLIAA